MIFYLNKRCAINGYTMCLLFMINPVWVIAAGSDQAMYRIEQRKDGEGDFSITSFGAFGIGNGKTAHIDMANFKSKEKGNGWGVEIGIGYSAPASVTFYGGGGIVLGYNSDASEFIASYFPEMGLIIQLTNAFGVSIARKRYYNLYGPAEDVTMLGLVFSYQARK